MLSQLSFLFLSLIVSNIEKKVRKETLKKIIIIIFLLTSLLLLTFTISINFEIFTPYIFILVSILLISKVPTYSMKKIVVPRSTTVFLLFSIVLLFGLLLVFTFEVIVISCMVYILSIPISIYHFMKLKKKYSITSGNEDDELEDVL